MVDQRVPSNDPRSLCESKLGPVSSFLKWWICVIRFFVTFWTTRYCGLNYICSLPSYRKALSNREWKANSLTWNIFLFSCNVWHSFSRTKCLQFTSIWKWGSWNSEIRIRSLFLGSIYVALSVFPKKREERGLISRPAVSNRAYLFHNCEKPTPLFIPNPQGFLFLFYSFSGVEGKKVSSWKFAFFPTVFADDQHLNISSGK